MAKRNQITPRSLVAFEWRGKPTIGKVLAYRKNNMVEVRIARGFVKVKIEEVTLVDMKKTLKSLEFNNNLM